jgi:hypothetical protein
MRMRAIWRKRGSEQGKLGCVPLPDCAAKINRQSIAR